ncbi:MAG: MBL fold metallo-hydrolase [Citrobacter freundii]|nr:MAG: MBL fold metallo-hydrolase [Citrobacter freundii]
MDRRNFIRHGALGIGALGLAQNTLLASLIQDPWTIKMLTDTIGVFTERGGTILFYLSKEGTVVVDTEFPEQANHLIGEMKKRSTQPFALLINTHHHGDHTGGNISFKGLTPHVLAHSNSLKNQQKVAAAQKSEDKQLFPDQTFTDTISKNIGGEKITLRYFGPAHTDGDALIHFENANIVHMGDLINNRRYPYIDRTAGASVKNWVKVLDKTEKTFDNNTTFVFGHASTGFEVYGKKPDIVAMRNYFEKLLAFTEAEIKAGKSKEDFLKNTSIPGVTEWVGEGIQRSLTATWDELTEA